MKRPKVTITTLNYNGSEATIEFLESLKNQTYRDFEVLVIDNCSDLSDFNKLKRYINAIKEFKVRLIRFNKNFGNSAGLNMSLEHINTEYTMFSDNDIILNKDCLEKLMNPFLGESNNIATTSPTIFDYNKNNIYSGSNYVNMFGIANCERKIISYKNRPVKTLSGACFIIKMSFLNKIGYLFPSEYFAYWEDVDLGWRIYNTGYKQMYVPKAFVRHKINFVSKKYSKMRLFLDILNTRNKYLTFYRNLSTYRFMLIWNLLLLSDAFLFSKHLFAGRIKKAISIPIGIIKFLFMSRNVKRVYNGGFDFLIFRLK